MLRVLPSQLKKAFLVTVSACFVAQGLPAATNVLAQEPQSCDIDGRSMQPGDWYVPSDKSALYSIALDCHKITLANAWKVMVFEDVAGSRHGYYMWPSPAPVDSPKPYWPPQFVPPDPPKGLIILSHSPLPLRLLALQGSPEAEYVKVSLLAQAGESTPSAFPFLQIAANTAADAAIKANASEAAVGFIAGVELELGTAAATILMPEVLAVAAGAVIVISVARASQIWMARSSTVASMRDPPSDAEIEKEWQSYDAFPVTALAEELSRDGFGRCKPEDYAKLRNEQTRVCETDKNLYSPICKRGPKGRLEMSVEELKTRAWNRWECARVRKEIMDKCFDRGNSTHRDEWRGILKHVKDCKDLLRSYLTSPP